MPDETHVKTKGFNLIRHEIEVMADVRYERDWYMLVNVLIVSLVLAFSVLAYLLKMNLETKMDIKSAALANKINTSFNPATRYTLRGRINSFEDKYTIYKDFQKQNFDLNSFYNDVLKIYPEIRISKFIVQPDSNMVDLIIVLDNDGYNDLPDFLKALETNPRFKNSVVKNINFAAKDNSKGLSSLIESSNDTGSFKTEISLLVEKQIPFSESM